MSDLFTVGECRHCHKNCLWISFVDGVLAELEFCSYECMEQELQKISEIDEEEKELTHAE